MLSKTKVKYIQSLGQKKFRQSEMLFIAEGIKIVEELISEIPDLIVEVFAIQEWVEPQKKINAKIPITEITQQELERISQLTTPNKVLAIIKMLPEVKLSSIKNKVVLALDGIQDPGNMGTIIRIADWFGIEQIVCSTDSADPYNPKVVQATMGSIARVKIIHTDLKKWLEDMSDTQIFAAVLGGKDVSSINKISEGVIIIGNESKGISPELLKLSNIKIAIPAKGKAESLNAAIATGIILSHLI